MLIFFPPLDTQLVPTIYLLDIKGKKDKNDARHFKKWNACSCEMNGCFDFQNAPHDLPHCKCSSNYTSNVLRGFYKLGSSLGWTCIRILFYYYFGVNFFNLGRKKKCERYKGFLYLKWAQKYISYGWSPFQVHYKTEKNISWTQVFMLWRFFF